MTQTKDTSFPEEPGRALWRTWLLRVLPGLGTALILAAVVYFFAANWQRIPPFVRLLLVEAGLALSVGAFLVLRRRVPHAADAALTAAGLILGVFWAVFGQIYQTGADAWQLFALWALGVAPWLLLRPATALWALWVTVLNIALVLWGIRIGVRYGHATPLLPALAVNLLVWAACVGAARLRPILRRRAELFGFIVLPFALACATVPVCAALLGSAGFFSDPISWPRTLAGMAGLAVVVLHAVRTRRPFPFFLLALCGYPLLNCALLHIVDSDSVGSILVWYTTGNVLYTLVVARALLRLRPAPAGDTPTFALDGPVDNMADDRGAIPATNSPAHPARSESVLSHLLGGLGGGLSALFVTALAAYTLYEADALHTTGMLVTALIFTGAGLAVARRPGSFARTLSLILPLTGFAFLAVGLADRLGFRAAAAGVALATAALYPFHRHAGWRFVSVLGALLCLDATFGAAFDIFSTGDGARRGLVFGDALTLLCGAPVLLLAWGRRPSAALRPALYAAFLMAALALPAWGPLYRPELVLGDVAPVPAFAPGLRPFTPFNALCGLALALLARREGRGRMTAVQNGAAFAGLLALLALAPAEATFALALLLVGHARALRALEVLGFVLLGIFLTEYYYLLSMSLVAKAFSIGIPGLLLLAGTVLVPAETRGRDKTPNNARAAARCDRARPPFPFRQGPAAVALLLVTLGTIQYAVHAKETLLKRGDTVLLSLAPTDPRSLMQGDYMDLSYALENELEAGDYPARGYAILRLDERGVGRLATVRVERGDLGPGHYAVPYRQKEWNTILRLPHSFLFEEGRADRYATAAYGILRCAPGGDCLLTGLADENGRDRDADGNGGGNDRR